MSETEPWTIKRLLEWTAKYLTSSGSTSGRLDAEVLLANAIGCERIQLYTSFDKVPGEPEISQYRNSVKLRAEGTPVAYLVHHREFFSMDFHVTPDVLIPRPETELLVVETLDLVKEHGFAGAEKIEIVDVGTGSGIVAIVLASQLKNASVTAIDISGSALEVAKKNAETHAVSDRVQFIEHDLMPETLPEKFDFIVSNPPYIGLVEKENLPPDVLDQEPHLALFGGQDGTEIIQRLVSQAANHLNPGGFLLFELSPIVKDKCVEIVNATGQFTDVRVVDDFARLSRVLIAKLS